MTTTRSTGAIVRTADGVEIREVPVPAALAPGEVRVAVEVAGLCRTDVYAATGLLSVPPGRVLGHEAAGWVLASRDPTIAEGDLVSIDPYVGCGRCVDCSSQGVAHAAHRCREREMRGVDRDGLFVSELVLPGAACVRVPGTNDARRAASLEPLAAALAVSDLALPRDARIVVMGSGRHAAITSEALRYSGHQAVFEALGPTSTRAMAPPDTTPPDVVVDTRGDEDSIRYAVESLPFGGTLVLRSRPATRVRVDLARWVARGITIRVAAYASFARCAAALADGAFPLDAHLGPRVSPEAFLRSLTDGAPSSGPKLFLDATRFRASCAA